MVVREQATKIEYRALSRTTKRARTPHEAREALTKGQDKVSAGGESSAAFPSDPSGGSLESVGAVASARFSASTSVSSSCSASRSSADVVASHPGNLARHKTLDAKILSENRKRIRNP